MATDPDSDDAREGPGDRQTGPFTGLDAVYTAAFSKIIKNIQRNLAPAWRVTIPVIPPIAFKLPPVPVVQLPKLDLGIYSKIAADLAPVLQAQHDQIAKVFSVAQAALQRIYPENWHGVTGLRFEFLEVILLDEGIPLVGVPRAATVQAILDAPDAAARRTMIGRRWRSIMTDCARELDSFRRVSIQRDVQFACKIMAALRDGHTEAAQALAANLLDSLLRKHFTADFKTITDNKPNGRRLDLDDYTLRVACVVAPIWAAYRQFWTNQGDPVPRTFARHASAHAVSAAQYTRTNAVLATMLVTSLLWLLEHEPTG